MPDFPWSCHACHYVNEPEANECIVCSCPAFASNNQILEAREKYLSRTSGGNIEGTELAAASTSSKGSTVFYGLCFLMVLHSIAAFFSLGTMEYVWPLQYHWIVLTITWGIWPVLLLSRLDVALKIFLFSLIASVAFLAKNLIVLTIIMFFAIGGKI